MSDVFDTFRKLTAKAKLPDNMVSILADRPPVEHISTGSLGIDCAVGPFCPGIPLGRLTQVFGEEQSGKSLLMCQIMGQAQKAGYPVFLVDREVHYTPEWYGRFGGDASSVLDLQPQTVEQFLDHLRLLLDSLEATKDNKGALLVIDSLQSLPTEKMYNADMASSEALAASAALFAKRLPGVIDRIHRTKLAIVSVGQIRDNPGMFVRHSDRIYTPGGNALKHFTVLRLFMRLARPIMVKEDNGDEVTVGFTSKVQVMKNNVGGRPRGTTVEVDFYNYGGSDDTSALFDIAVASGIISGGPLWYTIVSSGVKFQGKKVWAEHCTPAMREEIRTVALDPKIQLSSIIEAGIDCED